MDYQTARKYNRRAAEIARDLALAKGYVERFGTNTPAKWGDRVAHLEQQLLACQREAVAASRP
jgi:hypothetical protein